MRRRGRYSRHLYNAYDLDLKRSVVIFAEKNGNKEAQAHYGISEANIRRWRRLKHDIFGNNNKTPSRNNLRLVQQPQHHQHHQKTASSEESQSSECQCRVVDDSMPLQERLSKVVAQEKIAAAGQVLKSQPLSPTKLKVTRQKTATQSKPQEHAPQPPQSQSPANEEMCLRWNSHHSNMQTAFPNILLKEQYVDVTLAAEGKTLKCHRLILSSCSPYFEEILSGISPFQHPVLFMRDIPFWILKSLCDFMYAGEVHIYQNKLEELLTVAEALKIKGLAGKSTPSESQPPQQQKEVGKRQQERVLQPPAPPPLRKNPIFGNYESTSQDYEQEDLLDPLDLLEPLYEEAAEEKKPPQSQVIKPKENKYQYQTIKKPFGRRLRKRKYSEQRDPSPPPVFSFRKGTRSRPNVKIPKYYHSDYSQAPKPSQNSQTDPLLDVDEIKTEPIDVEDNLIDYSDEENHSYMENSIEPSNSPIIITSAKPPPSQPQQDKFKKIKLSKPIITEVHTIEESNTTAGGLEVIKITVQQSSIEENYKRDTLTENGEGTLETDIVEEETEIGGLVEEPPPPEETPPIVEQAVENSSGGEPIGGGQEERVDVGGEGEQVEGGNDGEQVDGGSEGERADGGGENPEESTTNQEVPEVEEAELRTDVEEEKEEEKAEDTTEEEERRSASLDHLEKEAMNVANAINKENQEQDEPSPPDLLDDPPGCK